MQVLVNTDNHIHGSQELAAEIEATVADELGNLLNQLTRVEVHLQDENSHKGGDSDIRCAMEARIEGHQPVAATHHAGSVDLAVDGAATKLKAALQHTFGKLHDR